MVGLILRFWLLLWMGAISVVAANSDEMVVVTVTTTAHAASTVEATPTVPSPASYTSLSEFQDTILKVSNQYRIAHNADPLVWNETLVEYSKKWAERCIWEHSDGPYGENLAFGYPNASAAVVAWGEEGDLYDFQKPTGFTEKTGHFTQLVWKTTTEVGCAAINCGYTYDDSKTRRDTISPRAADGTSRAQGWYVVCEYTPAGNVVGDGNQFFMKNVTPKDSKTPSTTASSETPTATPSGSAVPNSPIGSLCHRLLLTLGVFGTGICLFN